MKNWLFITIDTEEDLWGDFYEMNPPLENIKGIIKLQKIMEKYSAVPTYLITYPVASSSSSVELLKSYYEANLCDIGAHCHPWNTPPIEEELGNAQSFLSNISSRKLVFKKIENLHRKIETSFNMSPTVFRAGRWGYGPSVFQALKHLKYKIDTSITPFSDWEQYGGPVFNSTKYAPFGITVDGHLCDNALGCYECIQFSNCLLEIPPTIGYLQRNPIYAHHIRNLLKKKPFAYLHILGMLDRLNLLNLRWLSPEMSNLKDLIALANRILDQGCISLNMFFHSTSLFPGRSPFVRNNKELDAFFSRIDEFLAFSSSKNIACIAMSKGVQAFQPICHSQYPLEPGFKDRLGCVTK